MSHIMYIFFKNLKYIIVEHSLPNKENVPNVPVQSLRRQTADIINVINVVPVSLFLTLNIIGTCSSFSSSSMESVALY